jgi:ribonuclease-3
MEREREQRLFERLGYTFADAGLLRLCLTHKSYANENPQAARGHNERLEFLGDAVLDFVVSDLLFARFPELSEGELSKLRASLVTESSLAEIARDIDLGDLLLIGRGEDQSGGRNKSSILSDALEALLAGVYLDSKAAGRGQAVSGVIERLIVPRLDAVGGDSAPMDFKTELQELVQKLYRETVRYRIIQELGPDHEKTFEAAVMYKDREFGRGRGRSKKQAEQAAAKTALESLQRSEGAAGMK